MAVLIDIKQTRPAAPETHQHFIAECFVFETERDSFKQKESSNSLIQDC